MSELKPCPFCGNVPEWDGYEPRGHEFVCRTCDLWGIRPGWWNRRAPNPLLPLVKELREALEMALKQLATETEASGGRLGILTTVLDRAKKATEEEK